MDRDRDEGGRWGSNYTAQGVMKVHSYYIKYEVISIVKVEGMFIDRRVGGSNSAENHQNIVVAQPLLLLKQTIMNSSNYSNKL